MRDLFNFERQHFSIRIISLWEEKQVLRAQMGQRPYESLRSCLLNQLTLFVFLNQYGHLKVGVRLSLVIVIQLPRLIN